MSTPAATAVTTLPHLKQNTQPPARRRRYWVYPVLVAALGAGAWFGWRELSFVLAHETTDDAQIEGRVHPVLPRVSGAVVDLLVADNQCVEAGQPLLRIDPRDYDVKVAGAEASLAQARADLAAKETLVAVVEANIVADQVSLEKARKDLARDAQLFQTGATPDRTYDDSRSAAARAEAQHLALLKQLDAAHAQVALSRTVIAQRETDLAAARLQLSYTTVLAPSAGRVSSRNVEANQFVQAGQPLLAITADDEVWVTANFKETQIGRMRAGQPVVFEVDAYPGVEFRGRVDSLAAATGATFALLPPDNATGNFVKVTQRVPVKILLDGPADPERPLRPGLSVEASVLTKAAAGARPEAVALAR